MPDRTNRFEKIEGSHFQRLRIAFLELVRLAHLGSAITLDELTTLEQIAIGFVTREVEMRMEHARMTMETLDLAQEQLVEIKAPEIEMIRTALAQLSGAPRSTGVYSDLLDQFREPAPRLFMKFESPATRAKRQASDIRRALLADQIRPGPWVEVEAVPAAAVDAVARLVEEARMQLAHVLGRLRGPEPCSVAEEQAQLVEVITGAAYLWAALRFTQ